MEWAGGNLTSFDQGVETLKRLLGLEISEKGLEKITERLGRERAQQRDVEITEFEKGKLSPRYREAPAVAVLAVDGGRVQVRAAESPPGVHEPCWKETKVADLSTYTSFSFKEDPEPEPPAQFLDPPKVAQLVQEIKGYSGVSSKGGAKGPVAKKRSARGRRRDQRPEPKVRTVVATIQGVEQFGAMTAAEAASRNFYQARKKAALGDGSLWIWALVAMHFVGFVPILDFLHLLSHLYAAAQAACRGNANKAWKLYVRLLRVAWAGKARELRELLSRESKRLGLPPREASEEDPRKILFNAAQYVESNRDRIDYPRYRREGLPISSARVESLIKQVNQRVKGTEKFWVPEGLEAVLQVRAAYLSEDGRGERFWSQRPLGRAVGSHRLGIAA